MPALAATQVTCGAFGTRLRGRAVPRQARGLAVMAFKSVAYEVHGIVQGVFFRAHTVDKARSLGCVGWVMNTAQGSVKGIVQGSPEGVEQMKLWLSTTGSPRSAIERCDFSGERQLESLEYTTFSTRRR